MDDHVSTKPSSETRGGGGGADRGAGGKVGRAENDGEGGGAGRKGKGRKELFSFPSPFFSLPLRRRFPLAPLSRPSHDLPRVSEDGT